MVNKEQCEKCWWYDVCRKTRKACKIAMGIDMRWIECPNNSKKSDRRYYEW